MKLVLPRALPAVVTLFVALICTQSHGALVFTNNVQANFTFTTVGTTLGLPDGTELPFVSLGALTFTLDDSVPGATTMNFQNVTGDLTVATPAPFAGATMRPFSFTSGQLQGITRDGLGNITGGNVVALSMLWEMNLGPNRLYTKENLPFFGSITGAPFSVGNVISGAPAFDVYLDLGNAATDPLVVIGKDRFLTITAVPEPSSLALLMLAGAGFTAFGRRRKWLGKAP